MTTTGGYLARETAPTASVTQTHPYGTGRKFCRGGTTIQQSADEIWAASVIRSTSSQKVGAKKTTDHREAPKDWERDSGGLLGREVSETGFFPLFKERRAGTALPTSERPWPLPPLPAVLRVILTKGQKIDPRKKEKTVIISPKKEAKML